METTTLTNSRFLSILQLASPSLPVGAYSYSEGLEVLVENRTIHDRVGLKKLVRFRIALRFDSY